MSLSSSLLQWSTCTRLLAIGAWLDAISSEVGAVVIIRAILEAGVAIQFHVPRFTSNSGVMYIYRGSHTDSQ